MSSATVVVSHFQAPSKIFHRRKKQGHKGDLTYTAMNIWYTAHEDVEKRHHSLEGGFASLISRRRTYVVVVGQGWRRLDSHTNVQ